VRLAGAVAALALAARIQFPLPGTPVPQSLQTLAVVLAGAFLGPRLGALALGAYLTLGAAGLPLFARGGAGVSTLLGPTGGFLLGFVPAAVAAGLWMEAGWGRRLPGAALGMLVAHGVVLAVGWGRLALLLGVEAAFRQGVAPFLAGAVVKSLAAAGVLHAVTGLRSQAPAPPYPPPGGIP